MTSKELTTTAPGAYLAVAGSADILAALAENLGGESASPSDLPSVKVPAGGGVAWEVPTPDGFESARSFTGVIAFLHSSRLYWSTGMEEGSGTPPDCYSNDGEFGRGDPGGECAKCPLNQFGEDGEAKACNQGMQLYVRMAGDPLPTKLRIPPGSLKTWRQYAIHNLARAGKTYYQVETVFELDKAKSKSGITYSQIKFSRGRDLAPDEVESILAERAKIQETVG